MIDGVEETVLMNMLETTEGSCLSQRDDVGVCIQDGSSLHSGSVKKAQAANRSMIDTPLCIECTLLFRKERSRRAPA
jgi:hypothetical protein